MKAMIGVFINKPNLTNAKRLMAYLAKHPMATLFATADDLAALERAKEMVEGE